MSASPRDSDLSLTGTPASDDECTTQSTASRKSRSRNGCWTCRGKKVRCDEQRPHCLRCIRLSRDCDYAPRPRKRITFRRTKIQSDQQLSISNHNQSLEVVQNTSTPKIPPDPPERETPSFLSIIPVSRGQAYGDMCSVSLCSLPILQVSSASSLELSHEDHSAIHHFRTTLSMNLHTKNPQYSVLSIIFHLAKESPMLMHMVIALAGRSATYFRHGDDEGGKELETSIEHYNMAVHAMVKAVECTTEDFDLGVVLAALWLMIVYEQKYGDGDGAGLSDHLKGTASILKQRCRSLVDQSYASQDLSLIDDLENQQDDQNRGNIAATFAARMMVWLSALDAGAASYGIGGHVNSSIVELIGQCADADNKSPIDGFSILHRYSRPLFRMIWGESYPQNEILDDIQNQEVYNLYGECFQLRYMVARLAALLRQDETKAHERSTSVYEALEMVGRRYSELLEASRMLKSKDRAGERFVSNILSIVPHYHAATLEYYRVVRAGKPLNQKQQFALKAIIALAFQGYKNDGDRAMLRIPWPLFIAGIETDDMVHREWILNRFQDLGRYGRNYRRASKVLKAAINEQENAGRQVDILQLLESGTFERFVI